MRQSSLIVFSCLVFLLALVLFGTIFQALGFVLIFIIGFTFLEILWMLHQALLLGKIFSTVIKLVLSAGLAISFYAFLFLPVEFFITEIWLKMAKLPKGVGLTILILLVFFFSLFSWQKYFKSKISYFFLTFFFYLSSLVYLGYRNEKLAREYLPKIYKISPVWGIQEMPITIEGVNFFQIWRKGKILVGEEEMNIIFWDEKKIVAQMPVPEKFGETSLVVIRDDNVSSNRMNFEIIDPNALSNKGY